MDLSRRIEAGSSLVSSDSTAYSDVPVTPEDIDAAIVESNEASEIVDSGTDDIHRAIVAATALEDMAEDILFAMQQRGEQALSPLEHRMVNNAIDSAYSGTGLDRPEELAMEAFDGQVLASGIARLKEQALEIIKKIIAAFKKLYDWLVDYFHKVSSAAGGLASRARKLEIKARSVMGVQKSSTYTNLSLAKKLYNPEDNLVKAAEAINNFVAKSIKAANGDQVGVVDDLIKRFGKEKDATYLDATPSYLASIYKRFYETDYEKDGVVHLQTKTLLGGYAGYAQIPQELSKLGELQFGVESTGEVDSDKVKADIAASNFTEIKSILRVVNVYCAGIYNFDKDQRSLNLIKKDLDLLHASIKTAKTELSKQDNELLKLISRVAPKIVSGMHKSAFAYAVNAGKSLISHCEHSLALYQGEVLDAA